MLLEYVQYFAVDASDVFVDELDIKIQIGVLLLQIGGKLPYWCG